MTIDDETLIARAHAFAARAHEGQVRKGASQEPCITHLEEVAGLAADFGAPDEVVAAAWLHDTVEDCGVSRAMIETQFGPAVAALVAEMTDDKSLPKAERKAAQVRNAPGKSPGAALVNICDKISNVRAVADSPALNWDKVRQYAYVDWAETVVRGLPAGADPGRSAMAAALARARAMVAIR
jgi:(p)ppGpp synthase/HD superfamily hydrolase